MQIDTTSYRSPNYNNRPPNMAIDSLVIHTTEGPWPDDIEWLCSKTSRKSSHYVISPAGEVYEIVDPAKRAWHAGVSYYAGRWEYNDFSIGIELSHVESSSYPAAQRAARDALVRQLIPQYNIPAELVVTHRWIAVPAGRKIDPTDWSDSSFRTCVKSIYNSLAPVDPLKVRTIPGVDRDYYCGVGFYDAYYAYNGVWTLGYPLSDETPAIDQNGMACTYMPFERGCLKYSEVEGVRPALLSEAESLGWI